MGRRKRHVGRVRSPANFGEGVESHPGMDQSVELVRLGGEVRQSVAAADNDGHLREVGTDAAHHTGGLRRPPRIRGSPMDAHSIRLGLARDGQRRRWTRQADQFNPANAATGSAGTVGLISVTRIRSR